MKNVKLDDKYAHSCQLKISIAKVPCSFACEFQAPLHSRVLSVARVNFACIAGSKN
jgi:hypothetical protein